MIKQLSINGNTFDTSQFAKLNQMNTFTQRQLFVSNNSYPDFGNTIDLINPDLDLTVHNYTQEVKSQIIFKDKDYNRCGYIQNIANGNQLNFQLLVPFITDNIPEKRWFGITIGQDRDLNTAYINLSHSPSISSNNVSIATTQWVRNLLASKGL